MISIHRPLINLDQVTAFIDQERSRQAKIAAAVKEIAVEDVVNTRVVLRSAKNRKREAPLTGESLQFSHVLRLIDIHAKQLNSLPCPFSVRALKLFQFVPAILRCHHPEIEEYWLASKRAQSMCAPIGILQGEIRGAHGNEQPGLYTILRKAFALLRRE